MSWVHKRVCNPVTTHLDNSNAYTKAYSVSVSRAVDINLCRCSEQRGWLSALGFGCGPNSWTAAYYAYMGIYNVSI